jgi:hypothetical protein
LGQILWDAALVEASKLTPFQENLIRALGTQTLKTKALSAGLEALTGKVYGLSGQVKGGLSELVKRGFMTSDRYKGYELTKRGRGVLADLLETDSQDHRPD